MFIFCYQGRLFECQFFNADAWVCLSQDRQRKYDWVEYENGIELGEQKQCISEYIFLAFNAFIKFIFKLTSAESTPKCF